MYRQSSHRFHRFGCYLVIAINQYGLFCAAVLPRSNMAEGAFGKPLQQSFCMGGGKLLRTFIRPAPDPYTRQQECGHQVWQ